MKNDQQIDPQATPTDSSTKKLTPAEIELKWYREVYQGDKMPQLTVRSVIMGGLLGSIMSLSNLYVGLKTGWALGVAITSCILSFSIYRTLNALLPNLFKTQMSILENNCMQSTATSAGVSTGGTMVSAIAAYLMITGHHMPWLTLTLWTFFLASLGVFLAIPMKRQMINIEQLRFPSGIAAAETLRSLHSHGKEAMQKARSLGIGGLIGGAITWLRDARPYLIPGSINFPGTIAGFSLSSLTISLECSTLMCAAGAIMGWKIAWSLMLGAGINYGILAPLVAKAGVIDASHLEYRTIVAWSTWTGASIMVSSALVAFAMQAATIKRALIASTSFLRKTPEQRSADRNPLDHIEVPTSWFLTGTILSGAGCVAILYFAFDTSITMGIVAVALTFLLGVVACRATGESDITPIGAMGKITQLTFGILAPARIITNLMTAAVTAGAAGASADLLTDLKSGYVLGANPRKQFIAQYLGIFFGTIVVVPAFYLLVPTAASLGGTQWPAPAAQVWTAVARLLQAGLESLHPTARLGLVAGGLVGFVLPLLDRFAPQKAKRFIPSAMGLGLSMVIPFYNSLSMFLGAFIVLLLEKYKPAIAEKYTIPVSSGLIAGESILGIVITLLTTLGAFG